MPGEPSLFSAADYTFMAEAIRLAEKGLYTTSPNPRVGCVIVKNHQIIGRGWHEKAGQPHAEINALKQVASEVKGSTVYVTLEPCCHYGRTPPCTDTLMNAGIAKLVIAAQDPNPRVAGKGIKQLKAAGIEVQYGLLEAQANQLNIGFVSRMTRQRPWITVKIASSLDGKIALANGKSQWITGEAARTDVHRLRARSCAILTGINTVKQDDPELSVRYIQTTRQPFRVILDNRLEIATNAKVLQKPGSLIFTTLQDNQKIDSLSEKGAQVIVLPSPTGKLNLVEVMSTLAELEINELFVEAGSTLNGALIESRLVDEIIIYCAPIVLGNHAQSMLNLPELTSLSQKWQLEIKEIGKVGSDIKITTKLI